MEKVTTIVPSVQLIPARIVGSVIAAQVETGLAGLAASAFLPAAGINRFPAVSLIRRPLYAMPVKTGINALWRKLSTRQAKHNESILSSVRRPDPDLLFLKKN